MNTKLNQKLALSAFCLFLVTGLTACSTTPAADKPGAAPADNKDTATKPAAKTKLTYWTGDRHDADYIKEVIEKFNTTNKDNIEVELVVKTEDFNQAIDLSFSSAETPDIIRVKENTIQTFYKKQYLAPIDSYLTAEQKKNFPAMIDLNSFDGKMYSLPNYGTTMRLIYNVDLFEKAGIKNPPTTLKEMVDTAKKLTEAGKATGSYGFAQNFKSPESALGRSARVIAEVSGYGGFGYDFKTAKFDFSGFKPIIEAFKQMKDDGSTLPGMESLDIDPLRAQFAEGKIGMYMSFSSEPGVYKSQFPAKIKWAAAPVPSIDGSIKGASGFLGGQWLSISSKSTKKDQAWKFINFMYQEEVLQTYHEKGFGISMVPSVIAKAKKPDIGGIEGFLPNKVDGVWPIQPIVNVKGIKYSDAFFKYMLSGGDLNEVITDLNKRYNEALAAGVQAGEFKVSPMADFDPAKLGGQFAK
ncbi:ABC transporter substrate-binding protein [Paenibacillus sp. FSL H7-0331]|uniref:ABC transporter substrate-binding protein n=1 Tax=Paenibacillus sp. FSL H7-0331 TaxID=1920421 RepID=UPI00096CC603|nr:sugar ABC transporter substrate-binding protein [Paenibacillus sp. FSL H7-0331]OMF11637.1 ABC transporter substrate-binding protein [Paenibacillus sp. FSL H7-0331]